MTELLRGATPTVALREGDDLVVAELEAGAPIRQSRLPGCQSHDVRLYRVRMVRHDRGISVIAPAVDGGAPVHVADDVGGEFTTLPASPATDPQPGQYHVLRDGTTVLVGAVRRPTALGTVRSVHRLPWGATAWEELSVPDLYLVLGVTSTPEEPLVLTGGRLEAPDRSGEPRLVPVLLTPVPTGDGWRELDLTGWGRPSVAWRLRLGGALVDPRTGAFAEAAGAGDLWCAATEFGDWWEHTLLYAADVAERSWSFLRLSHDSVVGRPSVAADGVTAVSAAGRLLRYARGARRWRSSDLRPVLRGLHPDVSAGVTVTDMAVAENRLVLVVGPSGQELPRGQAVCSLPLDGTSAEVLLDTAGSDRVVRALTA
ncbi:hypothetical protein [Kitasatospora sp. SUK 42]|uniref:hypothetical protein n=1 Tax=Kitasatospora sp. SUK 42 TaxID=1588882 RepID=UPI0018CBAFC3|nr:hypothetical protein [Kitasatospora sp. SUK 42]MBV2155821.1 hypothetical protein [Kitasatospora sp. SUK 42]